ncbi:enoyl-CoA hydratase/isomerase family protein [Sinimarinibacterium flocculans]|uniref:enoyl-CoA hydratase/isomerase family protein n=1 Tax=Sinimarinibacterium flocculans TaxID=985250 RepID=UPI003511B9D4
MSEPNLLTERRANIFVITFNREEKMNAMTRSFLDDLKAALDSVKFDDTISVVVLKATGKAFTTGYDLDGSDWILSQNPIDVGGRLNLDRDREDIKALLEYWWAMWKFPKPIIAQVQGLCLSGGGELIAMCDLVVASETAKFGHPAGRDLGIPPTVFLWPMLIGMKKTREFLYTARLFSATEAERLGLVNRVVPAHELEATVDALATDVARTPANNLAILKQATSRFYENMGLFASGDQAAELDAVFHQSETFVQFFAKAAEDGLQAALHERRRRFG